MTPPSSFEVAFGISGSISAYKSLDVIRHLRKSGILITPILSSSATKFVTPWTVETLAESPLIQSDVSDGKISHLDQLKSSDAFVICPASANTIAKLVHGRCQDLLTASFLSFTGPKILFPAMHTEMYQNDITQMNLSTLADSGVIIIPPDAGELACGDVGLGRLPDTALISQIILAHLSAKLPLFGKHVTVTCGGTTEPIDPVRYISNQGSGLSGHAIANIAAAYGAHVTLIRANEHPTLSSISCVDVSTAEDMQTAVLKKRPCDAFIMNAAVSDFTITPALKKQRRGSLNSLQLEPTNDIFFFTIIKN